ALLLVVEPLADFFGGRWSAHLTSERAVRHGLTLKQNRIWQGDLSRPGRGRTIAATVIRPLGTSFGQPKRGGATLLQGAIRAIVYAAAAAAGTDGYSAKTGIVLGNARLHVDRQCGGYSKNSQNDKAHTALLLASFPPKTNPAEQTHGRAWRDRA